MTSQCRPTVERGLFIHGSDSGQQRIGRLASLRTVPSRRADQQGSISGGWRGFVIASLPLIVSAETDRQLIRNNIDAHCLSLATCVLEFSTDLRTRPGRRVFPLAD